jgi:hypothetical protein
VVRSDDVVSMENGAREASNSKLAVWSPSRWCDRIPASIYRREKPRVASKVASRGVKLYEST